MTTYNVTVPTKISAENISDLVISALEGGSNYWLSRIRIRPEGNTEDPTKGEFWQNTSGAELKEEAFWANLSTASIVIELAEEEEPDDVVQTSITRQDVETALGKLYQRRGGFDMDNFDAEDGDMFLQVLLLKEHTYG
jgi:hypothetical protein